MFDRIFCGYLLCSLAQVVSFDPNYPPPIRRPTWCSVPNYRYYRFTPTLSRGYRPLGDDAPQCGLPTDRDDDCFCALEDDCKSGYCVPDATPGLTFGIKRCFFPIAQVSEVEFWRNQEPIRTDKVPDEGHDKLRVTNGADVSMVWGVWELEFYSDTLCTNRITGGAPIASSERPHGFGHSVDHTAPLGAHGTSRTYWQEDFDGPLREFELHGAAQYAFDGDVTTNWWPTCGNMCKSGSEWIGLDFGSPLAPGVGAKCFRIIQDKDRDYASFSLIIQGHLASDAPDDWTTLAKFHAATWDYGGVWEQLSVPQGVAFPGSTAHARLLDGIMNSSAVEIVGTPFIFDFGVEVEVDSWRWATAIEPSDYGPKQHDGFTCNWDGRCPRDPVRWTLEGSLDNTNWYLLQDQSENFHTTIYRMSFTDLMPLTHSTDLSIEDVWPDGRGRCAKRR